ncbi:hypothetical protein B0H10DRAFT_1810955, partial [Mycena sp. CBHHK59/15]
LPEFLSYSMPLPFTRYSESYFGELKFHQTIGLEYPAVHEPKTISGWTFTNETPTDISALIEAGEIIPHIEDLAPISKEMEQACASGARSVAVTLIRQRYISASNQAIRLFNHINNNRAAFQSARELTRYRSATSLLPPHLLHQFTGLAIRSKVVGFQITDFPLWKLSCLLTEEWLHEDVLNALAELLYFSPAATSTEEDPTTLIFPTSFLTDAKYLFTPSPCLFSLNPIALRNRLQTTQVDKIFALNCSSNHYSVYRDNMSSAALEYGDSMHLLPDSKIMLIFQWLLSGTRQRIPIQAYSTEISRQATDSGSCGIAAQNFIETDLEPGAANWGLPPVLSSAAVLCEIWFCNWRPPKKQFSFLMS